MLLEMQTGAGGPPEAVEGVWLILRVGTCEKKRIFFYVFCDPFHTTNDQFAKTGSGQS